MQVWAIWTALFHGGAAFLILFASLLSGMAAGFLPFLPFLLVFFGVPAACAAFRVLPERLRGRFRRVRVRPGTVPAALLNLFAWLHIFVAIAALFAFVTQPSPVPSPDGWYYIVFPLIVVGLVGGGVFIWTYEKLFFPEQEARGS